MILDKKLSQTMSNTKKVLAVAETSYIIRKGLVYVLSQLSSVGKVVELKEMEDINYQLDILQPDAVLINPMLLGHSSRQDVRQQLNLEKKTAVIALVYNLIDEQFYRSYDGIIKINDSESKIEETLDKCLNKDQSNQPDQEELSDREKEILISVVTGMSNKEIADHHNISIHTAITHRRNITRKLKVHSISGLTIYAIINKLVDISEIKYQDE
ncbi:two-component system response regulator NreC [Dysgonomonas sp. PFB1-18]|uniref:LuxR C-terminal-related transcriptional regulator n=1 Tax=unclassified Dysgonomonas TaxID=2630389 RepID=UPI002476B857|nr:MULTISPECIES: LuxR C-terminal-related transcriptional regulator [unclassified Dysgonomonas]MDH6307213.1 two-component system response regulator NreC [Dysgonomonas sp. PF1-14]MDH6337132.1 two-component system response regulator NreC [Dysgonomonas sp. PF1-16]MDH6381118.1 two-component system response regulator NreC [Dysgonomonas sp. PFB1-18]MDH6396303.1 two-component system response regulator NreC [Dysgonomonas sp. PF1-23]